MDSIDQKLISLLRRNGRASHAELSADMAMSRATIRARLEKLAVAGEIIGFTVIVKSDIAEQPVRALMMIGIEGRGTERIVSRLSGIASVQAVHTTNGKWDLVVEIGTDTLADLDQVLTQIRRFEGVAISETSILLATRKAQIP
ncbi:MAG: Lrp/AsnC family transcriptional regulator [Rhodobacteraceae bacterium]|nr:Lrp/AsnC family transcriptional regulator [Paracoccaceae bacterium]